MGPQRGNVGQQLIEDLGPHVSSAQYAALLAHGKAESISLKNIFGFLRGGFLWSKSTDSLLNVCNDDGELCTGYLAHADDAHRKRLQHPLESSLFEFEAVKWP